MCILSLLQLCGLSCTRSKQNIKERKREKKEKKRQKQGERDQDAVVLKEGKEERKSEGASELTIIAEEKKSPV